MVTFPRMGINGERKNESYELCFNYCTSLSTGTTVSLYLDESRLISGRSSRWKSLFAPLDE